MIRYCTMRISQAVDTVKATGVKKLLKEIVFFNREAVPVEMDLARLRPMADFVPQSGERLIELKPDMIGANAVNYPIKSRASKAAYYFSQGYRGFAMVENDRVSGDIWCATTRSDKDGLVHPDEEWLKIRCLSGELYSFDMYLNPEKRGLNISALLQNGTLHELRKEGFTKAYGFFWADNIAALWVHRTLRWKELPRVRATRLVFSKKFVS